MAAFGDLFLYSLADKSGGSICFGGVVPLDREVDIHGGVVHFSAEDWTLSTPGGLPQPLHFQARIPGGPSVDGGPWGGLFSFRMFDARRSRFRDLIPSAFFSSVGGLKRPGYDSVAFDFESMTLDFDGSRVPVRPILGPRKSRALDWRLGPRFRYGHVVLGIHGHLTCHDVVLDQDLGPYHAGDSFHEARVGLADGTIRFSTAGRDLITWDEVMVEAPPKNRPQIALGRLHSINRALDPPRCVIRCGHPTLDVAAKFISCTLPPSEVDGMLPPAAAIGDEFWIAYESKSEAAIEIIAPAT